MDKFFKPWIIKKCPNCNNSLLEATKPPKKCSKCGKLIEWFSAPDDFGFTYIFPKIKSSVRLGDKKKS